MNYLGITLKTTEWLLANPHLFQSFKNDLKMLVMVRALSGGVVTAGQLRVTSSDENLIAIWNNDYLTGTDTEDWGFIKLKGEFGILSVDEIYNETLERAVAIINFRLQHLNLPDDRFIHRTLGDNLHTCLSGRGDARQYSLGWYEDKISVKKGSFHSILISGPSNIPGLEAITYALAKSKPYLPKLLESANDLLIKARQRPVLDGKFLEAFKTKLKPPFQEYDLPIGDKELDSKKIVREVSYSTVDWKFENWVALNSPLTALQREILDSDIILTQPLRIVGAAGTGKSLLMQLLVIRRLKKSEEINESASILYIVHNSEMANSIREKFITLGAEKYLSEEVGQKLIIKTLFEYACEELKLDESLIMDKDASQTKMYQRLAVSECIDEIFKESPEKSNKTDLLKKISESHELRDVFADIVVSEIGIGIKGRDLVGDKRRYVESEKPFTRFHGILTGDEREFVYEIFTKYNDKVNNKSGLLDSDDIAISFLGMLKTPLWGLRRRKLAFDFVFIDETQLFNQNERQIFRFLTKKFDTYLPIVIALDEAQEIRGSSSTGFGMLGIEHLANETLPNVHRCTEEILKLAFFVIQRTTDLFGSDFPDFTTTTTTLVKAKSNINAKPRLIVRSEPSIGTVIKKEITSLRKKGIRQIAVIIHPERYFKEIVTALTTAKENITVAEKRGELIDPKKPITYIARPDLIGGQEFEAVIVVGLEHGLTPPLITGHAGLSEALEQQTLREMYLSFTRAKYSLTIINNKNSSPTGIIQNAIDEKIIDLDNSMPVQQAPSKSAKN